MKKSFITGLIILVPIAITFFIFTFVLDLFTSPFLDLVRGFIGQYKKTLPFLTSDEFVTFLARLIILILFCLFIFLLGVLGRWFLFRAFLAWGNKILMKIPFFKSIYHTTKDLINAVISIDERKAFKHPLMVTFPSKKSMCVGFLSGSVPPQCAKAVKEKLTPIFVPTAPHPISGYLILAPDKEITSIKMTNEEAIKFTVSCGVITPESSKETKYEPKKPS